MLMMLTAGISSCVTASAVPRCKEWSQSALLELARYREAFGMTEMVRAIGEDAQTCAGLKKNR